MNAARSDELHALQTRGLEQQRQISRHQTELAAREAEIEHLKLVIAKLRRLEFGRRSERMTEMIGQLEGTRAEAPSAVEPLPEQASSPASCQPLPAHLPCESIEHRSEMPCCPACGGELETPGGRRQRTTRLRSRQFPGHPPCAFEARLREVRRHRPDPCPFTSDRARRSRGRVVGARARRQIRRPHSPVSAK
jgi:hypothetical protein